LKGENNNKRQNKTERDYVSDLSTIIEVFIKPLKESGIIKKVEIGNIFSNVELIYKVNSQLLEGLNRNEIGDSFLKIGDFLKVYSFYCGNQSTSITTLKHHLETNTQFETFLLYCKSRPECRDLDIGSFLIKPIQRICKYPLLLKEVLRNWDGSGGNEEERKKVEDALRKIQETVSLINEKKRDIENTNMLLEVQAKIDNATELEIIQPARKYVCEGTINKVNVKSSKLSLGYYFVFNDLFLYGHKSFTKSTIHISHLVPLHQAIINNPRPELFPNSFELVHVGQNKILFNLPTAQEKAALVAKIEQLITNQGFLEESRPYTHGSVIPKEGGKYSKARASYSGKTAKVSFHTFS